MGEDGRRWGAWVGCEGPGSENGDVTRTRAYLRGVAPILKWFSLTVHVFGFFNPPPTHVRRLGSGCCLVLGEGVGWWCGRVVV